MANSPTIAAAGGTIKVVVYSNGSEIAGTIRILSVKLRSALNRIPFAEIVLEDGDMPNKDFPVSDSKDFVPGTPIKVDLGYDDESETVFEGIVVKHGISISGLAGSRLILECRDKAVAMTVGRKNANFVDKKDSDIISALIGNYAGLSSDIGATSNQHREIVQYYCTDWDFMLSRAEINGQVAIVSGGKVAVKAPEVSGSEVLTVTYGDDLIEFEANVDALSQYSSVGGVAWSPKNQAIVKQTASPKALNDQGNLAGTKLAEVLGLDSFRLQTPVPLESAVIKSWAEGQQTKAGLSRIRGRMSFPGSAEAKVGCLIELKGVGDRFNGTVYVTGLVHTVRDGNWVTEVEFGMPARWFAENRDLEAPPASGMLPGIDGLHVGVVKKLDADPEGEFRVQVSIPVLEAETDGVWARLSKFYGTQGAGAFFVPEIGDEVLLGYLNNDPSNPVILGSLYSSNRTPAYTMTAENYKKAIVTKAKLKLEFDDEKKIITLLTPGNNTIVISDDGKSITLQDQTNNIVKLSEDGISLDSPKDITINAKGKITMTATGNISMTAQGDVKATGTNVTVTANASLTGKGNASAEISSPGQTTIKGSMVMIN
jgi:Rhs element Vgr protein